MFIECCTNRSRPSINLMCINNDDDDDEEEVTTKTKTERQNMCPSPHRTGDRKGDNVRENSQQIQRRQELQTARINDYSGTALNKNIT